MVSHELRNPLGVIRTSAFYLMKKVDISDEKVLKHLQRIEQQVGLCNSIIGELLEYTRGKRSAAVKGEINPWLEETLDQITVTDQVSLVRRLAPVLPTVHFDRDKMRRVLINLVENAIQAVMERQVAANEEKRLYRPEIIVNTARAENGVRIDVEDNGIGMDLRTSERAFEPLFTTRARGTGLGLAIVRKIIDEHGGSVSLRSRPDSGTTVTLIIPSEPPSQKVSSDISEETIKMDYGALSRPGGNVKNQEGTHFENKRFF